MSKELEIKLSQFHQRRKARESTVHLPAGVFEGSELNGLVYKEDIYLKHGLKLFPSVANGKYIYPEGYSLYKYIEVDQVAHLARNIEDSNLVFRSDLLVSLDNESGYWPLKLEKAEVLIEWYLNYLNGGYQTLTIFQSDFKKGIIIDNYCGYLPNDLSTNSNEVVYEYIRWEKI